MVVSEAQKKSAIKYKNTHIKRIPLDVQLEEYEQIKAHADASGESVNGYIKNAIKSRIESEDKN